MSCLQSIHTVLMCCRSPSRPVWHPHLPPPQLGQGPSINASSVQFQQSPDKPAAAWQIDQKDLQFCKDEQGNLMWLRHDEHIQVINRPRHHIDGLCAPKWQLAELFSCSLAHHAWRCASLSPSSLLAILCCQLVSLCPQWQIGQGPASGAVGFASGSCSPLCTSLLHLCSHTCRRTRPEPAAGLQGCMAIYPSTHLQVCKAVWQKSTEVAVDFIRLHTKKAKKTFLHDVDLLFR